MSKEKLAAKLNGRQYRSEMAPEEELFAKDNGLVVVFGASDDLMEFRGAIEDELDAYDGTTAYVTSNGLFKQCDNDDCPHETNLMSKAKKIKADWCELDGYSWSYRTEIPHASFDILEGKDKYCRGIVFSLKDVL